MDDNIEIFPGETAHDIPVSRVLDGAKDLETVLVLGYTKDGDFYVASNTGDVAALNYMIDCFKYDLLTPDIDG